MRLERRGVAGLGRGCLPSAEQTGPGGRVATPAEAKTQSAGVDGRRRRGCAMGKLYPQKTCGGPLGSVGAAGGAPVLLEELALGVLELLERRTLLGRAGAAVADAV
jgi:hypothetical protein